MLCWLFQLVLPRKRFGNELLGESPLSFLSPGTDACIYHKTAVATKQMLGSLEVRDQLKVIIVSSK